MNRTIFFSVVNITFVLGNMVIVQRIQGLNTLGDLILFPYKMGIN